MDIDELTPTPENQELDVEAKPWPWSRTLVRALFIVISSLASLVSVLSLADLYDERGGQYGGKGTTLVKTINSTYELPKCHGSWNTTCNYERNRVVCWCDDATWLHDGAWHDLNAASKRRRLSTFDQHRPEIIVTGRSIRWTLFTDYYTLNPDSYADSDVTYGKIETESGNTIESSCTSRNCNRRRVNYGLEQGRDYSIQFDHDVVTLPNLPRTTAGYRVWWTFATVNWITRTPRLTFSVDRLDGGGTPVSTASMAQWSPACKLPTVELDPVTRKISVKSLGCSFGQRDRCSQTLDPKFSICSLQTRFTPGAELVVFGPLYLRECGYCAEVCGNSPSCYNECLTEDGRQFCAI